MINPKDNFAEKEHKQDMNTSISCLNDGLVYFY